MWRANGKVCTAGGADGQSSLVSETAGARPAVGDILNEVTTPAQAEASTVSSKDAGGFSKLEQESSIRQELNELHAKVDAMWEKVESSSTGKTAPTAAKIPATQSKPKSALTEDLEKLKRENAALKQQMEQMRRRVSNETQKLEKQAETIKTKEEFMRNLKKKMDGRLQSLNEQLEQQQSNPLAVATGSQGLAQASTVAINRDYTRGQLKDRCDFCQGKHSTESCQYEDVKCLNCGGFGHKAHQCPKPVKCRYCKEYGHVAASCPILRKRNQER